MDKDPCSFLVPHKKTCSMTTNLNQTKYHQSNPFTPDEWNRNINILPQRWKAATTAGTVENGRPVPRIQHTFVA